MSKTRLLFGAVIALALPMLAAGCSNHEIDQDAWEADLAKHGVTVTDWPQYRAAIADVCDYDQSELEMYVAVRRDDGQSDAVGRLNIRYACPDRSDDFDAAIASSDDATSTVEAACDTPPESRTESQSRLAEAMAC